MLTWGLALAAEPVAPKSGGETPWIEVREAHIGRDVHCDAAVTLADNGRVSNVVVTGCEDPWKEATSVAVATWRYPKNTPDQVVGLDYPAPLIIRRDDMRPMTLDEAAVIYIPWRVVRDKLNLTSRDARERTRCDVEFFVDGYGLTYALDLSHCPEKVRVLAEHRLMRYHFEPESIAGRGLVPVRFRTYVVIR
jgi:hypothetical protein